ncbi:MAG: hypothetical protein K2F89_00545, partial [Treponemataceae bacterium]|nr:hypothetical protein [Treponemataceae bacterium]
RIRKIFAPHIKRLTFIYANFKKTKIENDGYENRRHHWIDECHSFGAAEFIRDLASAEYDRQ